MDYSCQKESSRDTLCQRGVNDAGEGRNVECDRSPGPEGEEEEEGLVVSPEMRRREDIPNGDFDTDADTDTDTDTDFDTDTDTDTDFDTDTDTDTDFDTDTDTDSDTDTDT
ncbi:MAG: hypothetical protein WCF69_13760, partial [Mycobacterium sp.]